MSEPVDVGPLTSEERYLIALLRQGPQSVHGVAEALHLSADQAQDALRRLDRKVGLVTLFRFGTLRYGLAE